MKFNKAYKLKFSHVTEDNNIEGMSKVFNKKPSRRTIKKELKKYIKQFKPTHIVDIELINSVTLVK